MIYNRNNVAVEEEKLPVYTAKFAGDPEYGWTFTPHCSGSKPYASRARFWANISILSINWLPP